MTREEFIYHGLAVCSCEFRDGKEWFEKEELIKCFDDLYFTNSEHQSEDAISRKAVLNTLDFCDKALDVDRTVEGYKTLLEECYKELPSIKPITAIEEIREEVYQMTLPSTHIFKGNTWESIRHGVNLALEIIDKHIADKRDTESEG